MRTVIPAYEFRRRAREAMKAVMPILLVVALIATLPSLISQAVTLITEADPSTLMSSFSNRMMQVLEKHGITQPSLGGELVLDENQLMADTLAVYEGYLADVTVFAREKGPILLALSLLSLLLSPVLTLGMINAMLHALRKQEFTASIALSRVNCILKALGLELLIGLKAFLWTLPGMALMIAACFLPEIPMVIVMLAGFVAMLVLGIMAMYRYALATSFLADEPTTRIRDCIRRSCEVMRTRKLELFSLELSFIGWRFLLLLARSLFFGFGQVIGMTLSMFASLFLTVYTNCAQVAFYQEYAVGPVASIPPEDADPADELN